MVNTVRRATGLVIDPYFSGTMIWWLLDQVSRAHVTAARGWLAFDTIDRWLIWKLTKCRVHATDGSNASRAMLFDIRHNAWDLELLKAPHIPASVLPKVFASIHVLGKTDPQWFGAPIPVARGQQSALFGSRPWGGQILHLTL